MDKEINNTPNSQEELKTPTLNELLEQCKPENKPEVIDFGIVGKELI